MIVREVVLTWFIIDGFFLLVFGSMLRHLLKAEGSMWPCVTLVLHSRDLGVGGGKPCGEMERALAAEAGSMSLSLKSGSPQFPHGFHHLSQL